MKKLLLKLAAVALCALSPHQTPVAAQTMHMDFQLAVDGHNSDLKCYNRASNVQADAWSVTEEGYTVDWPATSSTQSTFLKQYAALTKFENNDLTLEFDYTNCYYTKTADIYTATAMQPSFTSSATAEPYLRTQPGTAITITPKLTGKRIRKVTIKLGTYTASSSTKQQKIKDNIESWQAGNMEMVTTNTYKYGSTTCMMLEFVSSDMFGEVIDEPIKIALKKNPSYSLSSGTTIIKNSEITKVYAPLTIASIDIDYFEGDAPDYINDKVTGYVSNIKHWDAAASKWVVPSQTVFYGDTEKFRMGNVVTEFHRTENALENKPTVMIDPAKNQYLGAFIGVEFRSYPAEDFKYKGQETPVYKATYSAKYTSYLLSTTYSTTASVSASNLFTQVDNETLEPVEEVYTRFYSGRSAANDPDPRICTVEKLSGIQNCWIRVPLTSSTYPANTGSNNATANNNNAKVKSGDLPAVMFEQVTLSCASETPAPENDLPRPPAMPTITCAVDDNPAGNVEFSNPVEVTVAVTDANYPDAKLMYFLTDNGLEEFDLTKATAVADGKITVDREGVLYVAAVAEKDGQTYTSFVATKRFEKLDILELADYADLLNPDNAGKLITLDFVTKPIAASYIYRAQQTGTNQSPIYGVAYLLDENGNAIKLTTKYPYPFATGVATTGGYLPACINTKNSNLTADLFIGKKGIVGRLTFVDGHPVIAIADRESTNDPFDYKSLCSTTTLTSEEAEVDIEDFTAISESFEFDESKWGHFVKLRKLTGWDATAKTLIDNKGEGKTVSLCYGSDLRSMSMLSSTSTTTLTNATAETVLNITGIVDCDEDGNYFIMPRDTYVQLNQPNFTITGAEPREGEENTFDIALLSGKMVIQFNRSNQPSKSDVGSIMFYIYDENQDGKQLGYSGAITSETGTASITLQSTNLPKAVDDVYNLRIEAHNRANYLVAPSDIGDPAYVKLYDAVAYGFHPKNLSEFNEAYKDKTAADVLPSTYVTITNGSSDPTAIIAMNDKYMLVRDVTEGGRFAILKTSYTWDKETTATSSNGTKYNFMYHCYATSEYDWISSYFRALRNGDAIRSMTVKPVSENGNWLLDVTDSWEIFNVNGSVEKGNYGNPKYGKQLEELAAPELIDNADERELTDADLNKLVTIKGVHVTSDGTAYTTSGKTPLTITWNYLTPAATATANKALADAADASATFNVTGLLMADGQGGYAIEVTDFAPDYAKIAEVCDHEDHADTYYANIGFDAAEHGGKMVAARGAKIKDNGDGTFSIRLKDDVKLEWTSLPAQAAADKALITAAIENGLTTDAFNVAGKLSDDGTSIDVLIFEQLTTGAALDVFAGSVGVSNYNFYAYTTPVFNVGTEERIFFRMADTEEALDDAEEMVYDPDNAPRLDHSTWIRAYTCTPGAMPTTEVTRQLVKSSAEVNNLTDMVNTGNRSTFHFKGNLRVTDINAEAGYMVVTDGTTHASIHTEAETLAAIAEGDHLDEIVAVRDANTRHYRLSSSLPLQTVEPAVEVEILKPEAITSMPTADDHGRHVKIAAARIAGNVAEGLTLTSGEIASLPINDILGTLGDDLDTDAEYIVTGYVMPVLPAESADGAMALADETETETEPAPAAEAELWPSAITVRRTTATPTFKVEGARTVDYANGTAMTVGQATVTIECEEAAEIEYSLDGTNWLPYTEAITVDKSCTVSARATAEDMYVSATATMQIVRKYISADVAFDCAPKAGYTEVVIHPADKSMDPSTFTIHYTTDGTEPTADSPKYEYSKMLELDKPCTVKAILIENGADMLPSEVAEEQINVVSGNVTVSVRKGNGESFVTIAPASDLHLAANRQIFYTFDFDLPYDEWTAYTEGTEIRLTEDATIYAYMAEDGKDKGDDNIYDVTVTSTPTTPTDPTDPDTPTDPDDPSAIDSVGADQTASVSVNGNSIIAPEGSQAFDLTGRQVRMDGLRPGIYIVRTPDGKAVKLRINN